MDAAQPWLGLVSTAILNIAFAVAVGSGASLWMLGRTASAWSRSQSDATGAVLKVALVACLLAFALLLWAEAAVLSELPLLGALGAIGTVVMRTHVGHAWLVGTSALVLSLGVTLLRKHWRSAAGLVGAAVACAVVFAGAKSWMGHAGSSSELLPFVVDWVHLVAVSVWAGTVLLAVAVVLRGRDPRAVPDRGACASYIEVLSTTAAWSLAVVLGTGSLSAWRGVHGSSGLLFASAYGQVLLAKLVLVALAAAMGAQNRFFFMPRFLTDLRAPEPSSAAHRKPFYSVLCLESAVLVGALCAAAVLSSTAPPLGP